MRLIDAHYAAEQIKNSDLPNYWKDALLSCLSSIPTIATPPNDPLTMEKLREMNGELVVHGQWIDKGWDGDFSWRIDGRGNCWKVISCSVCGRNLCGSHETDYCPNCGAKMDLPKCGVEKSGRREWHERHEIHPIPATRR